MTQTKGLRTAIYSIICIHVALLGVLLQQEYVKPSPSKYNAETTNLSRENPPIRSQSGLSNIVSTNFNMLPKNTTNTHSNTNYSVNPRNAEF